MISMKPMGAFDELLRSDESLFQDSVALDYDYLPKLVPYRENEQIELVRAAKPLTHGRTGKNILIHGPPGIGKTVLVRHTLKELEDDYDEIIPIYINTWQKNTTFKIVIEICEKLNYKFTHNKKTEELFEIIKAQMNKKSVLFCFDEIDKAADLDFLYMILEQIYRKSIILITNYREWAISLDERLRSRLVLQFLEFKKYNEQQVKGILAQRLKYAFIPGAWSDDAFSMVVKTTAKIGDVRVGLHLLRESGNSAEDRYSRIIEMKDVQSALLKIGEMKIKSPSELKDEEQVILNIVKDNSGKRIGELFDIYKNMGGEGSYKTFQRRIEHLSKNKFISTQKQTGGPEGSTTLVNYERATKLDEF